MNLFFILSAVILSYLLGSVNGSVVLGRFKNIDIRTQGSGNAGGTNAFRTQGLKFALGVVFIDIGKGMLAAYLIPKLFGFSMPLHVDVILVCAAAAIIGHCYPIWHSFKGGKGAATLVGTALVLFPNLVLPIVSIWVLILILTGYVGLSTILAALSASVVYALTQEAFTVISPQFLFLLTMGLFIVFTHRDNIKKMLSGTESRFERMRLLHRLLAKTK